MHDDSCITHANYSTEAGRQHSGSGRGGGTEGTFWLSFETFLSLFDDLYVCRLFGPSWHLTQVSGEWRGASAAAGRTC